MAPVYLFVSVHIGLAINLKWDRYFVFQQFTNKTQQFEETGKEIINYDHQQKIIAVYYLSQ